MYRASAIKSIQPVSITIATGATSNTATITSVVTTNTVLIFGGFSTSWVGAPDNYFPNRFKARLELTNATTVTAYRNTSDGSFTVTVTGTAIEFYPGNITSVQRGTITMNGGEGASKTATITSVNTAKAVVVFLGQTTPSNNAGNPANNISADLHCARLDLTNATTVTATTNATNGDVTVGYQVVEWR